MLNKISKSESKLYRQFAKDEYLNIVNMNVNPVIDLAVVHFVDLCVDSSGNVVTVLNAVV